MGRAWWFPVALCFDGRGTVNLHMYFALGGFWLGLLLDGHGGDASDACLLHFATMVTSSFCIWLPGRGSSRAERPGLQAAAVAALLEYLNSATVRLALRWRAAQERQRTHGQPILCLKGLPICRPGIKLLCFGGPLCMMLLWPAQLFHTLRKTVHACCCL